MNNLDNNNKSDHSADKVKSFLNNNFKYLSTGVIFILLVVVVVLLVNGRVEETDKTPEKANVVAAAEKEFLKEEIPELDKLLSDYYVAYAQGDVETLKNYATPISAGEEQQIKTLSKYISSYRVVETYVKEGIEKGSYAVFTQVEMGFEDVKTWAPGSEFFYIKTNGQGKMYIDNTYGLYNTSNQEVEPDKAIEALIEDYENDADVEALQASVMEKYNAAVNSDTNLNTTLGLVNAAVKATGNTGAVAAANDESKTDTKTSQSTADSTKKAAANKDNNSTATTTEKAASDTTTKTTDKTKNTSNNTVKKIKTEKVYAIDNVNIRNKANETSKKVGSAMLGDSFKRTGTTKSGWSQITYKGKKAYIKSEFLSKKKPKVTEQTAPSEAAEDGPGKSYLAVGTTLTLNSALNVRKSMSETADLAGTAAPGEVVKVVLSYAEGWTKVEWNGITGYIKTELLIAN